MAVLKRTNRKHDRNRKRNGQNAAYKLEKRHEKSHIRRISKHLARFPADNYARQMLATYRAR